MLKNINANAVLNRCAKEGLQAINGSERAKFKIKDTKKLKKSINIDSCLKNAYPNANRWDYLVVVDDIIEGYFVEIHPANTSEVKAMIAKKSWLQKEIINNHFKSVDKSKFKIVWIATDAGIHIIPTSSEYKRLAKENLIPRRKCII